MTNFEGLQLAQPLLRAIAEEGYTTPTPIQARAIPPLLEGKDLIGIAQTGTGKTAAFALPLLHRLTESNTPTPKRGARALILAPTRELAAQISISFKTYNKHLRLWTAVAYGGVSIKTQIKSVVKGVDVMVATPGRLLDLVRQDCLRLDQVEFFVLDEADRMLDMGFAPDVKTIAGLLPSGHQTAMFSATMAKEVQGLAASLLHNPVRVEVAPVATAAEKVEQRMLFVRRDNKRALLDDVLNDDMAERVLIFTRTKHGADAVARHLEKDGMRIGIIHGNRSQAQRERAINGFRRGRVRALVATDIAARGIDVDGVTHVINYDLPNEPDSYVHRIGRTGRAGATGIAISFCDREEKYYLRDIERLLGHSVPVITDHAFHDVEIANDPGRNKPKGSSGRGGGRKNAGGGRQNAGGGKAARPRDGYNSRSRHDKREAWRPTAPGEQRPGIQIKTQNGVRPAHKSEAGKSAENQPRRAHNDFDSDTRREQRREKRPEQKGERSHETRRDGNRAPRRDDGRDAGRRRYADEKPQQRRDAKPGAHSDTRPERRLDTRLDTRSDVRRNPRANGNRDVRSEVRPDADHGKPEGKRPHTSKRPRQNNAPHGHVAEEADRPLRRPGKNNGGGKSKRARDDNASNSTVRKGAEDKERGASFKSEKQFKKPSKGKSGGNVRYGKPKWKGGKNGGAKKAA